MSTASKPQGQAMYLASRPDRDWLLNVQRKLYARSRDNPDYVFHQLWGLVTDLRNLRNALARVARNRGRRTAGVDGVTLRNALDHLGAERLVEQLRGDLRSGAYGPSPVRRVLIPKVGQPGKFRPLGIPTVNDRIVQAALKNILEPIFEPDFYPTSHGFRAGKSTHGALEHLRMTLRPKEAGPEAQRRLPYQWAIEGDIKACFDNIDHHALMGRVRRRIGDLKTNRLVGAFLKAGVISDDQLSRTTSGTPQGGILSPLLANIALATIDERYERHVWPRRTPTLRTDPKEIMARACTFRQNDRRRGLVVCFPIRYADDFIVLVGAPPGPRQHEQAREAAMAEKTALAAHLRNTIGLELSEAKTKVTPVTEPLRFLGHHIRVRRHPVRGTLVSTAVIPKDRTQRLRELVKALFSRKTMQRSLGKQLETLNLVTRGWSQFYRHAWGAKTILGSLDHYVWWTILRWLRKKHRGMSMRRLAKRYGWHKPGGRTLRWRDGDVVPFEMVRCRVEPFRLAWLKGPGYRANTCGEPGA